MRSLAVLAAGLILAAAASSEGCGGESSDPPLGDRLTMEAADNTPLPATVAPPTLAPSPSPAPTVDAATTLQLRSLGRLVVVGGDLPPGYTTRDSQDASKAQIVEAQIAIPELAIFLRDSDLLGAWAALYTNEGPPATGVSSIIYLFTTPEDARGFVTANGEIQAADYLSATLAEPLAAEPIGDTTVLMHFTTLDGESFEYTWSQGQAAGQVIMRYVEQTPPDAPQFAASLAAIQAQRMATFVP